MYCQLTQCFESCSDFLHYFKRVCYVLTLRITLVTHTLWLYCVCVVFGVCVCVELSSEEKGVESINNPLDGVTAGLLDSSGQQIPLQAVHVKCKLMDLLSQVIQNKTAHSSLYIFAVITSW